MVNSKICNLYNLPQKDIIKRGGCPMDGGGYFILKNGLDYVIVSQIRNAPNVLQVFNNHTLYSQVITENNEKIERFLIMKNTSIDTNKIAGYRIQLAFNTDRTVIDDTKAHFLKLFLNLHFQQNKMDFSKNYIHKYLPLYQFLLCFLH